MSDDMARRDRKPSAGAQFEGVATVNSGARETVPTCPRCTEAAAFLDRMADRLESSASDWSYTTADCRALAARLRGKT